MLLHDDVRRLNKGNALRRVFELREETVTSTTESTKWLPSQMLDDGFVSEMCLLGDIFHHLNALNLDLKGGIKNLRDNFAARFNDLVMSKELLQFVKDLFVYFPKGTGVPYVT